MDSPLPKLSVPQVQGADIREQLLDVSEAGARADQVGAGTECQRVLARADFQIAAHARGQVQYHVDPGGADAVDDLAVQIDVAAAMTGFRVAYMAVDHGGAGPGRFDRGRGDLPGRHGNSRMLSDRIAGTGDGTGYNDFVVHVGISSGRV